MQIIKSLCMASLLLLPLLAQAADNRPVTTDKFNRLIEIMKNMYRKIDALEEKQALQSPASPGAAASSLEIEQLRAKVKELEAQMKGGAAPAPSGADGAVNLDDMDSSPAPKGHHAASGVQPLLKIYFDLNLYSLPGGPSGGSGFTFDNFHSFVLLDVNPNEDLSFSTIIETTPHYYEIDYKLAKSVTLRLGKIWIPFDDLSPHNIFGGMTNISRIWVGEAFLPDLFTDLGVGLTWKMFDSSGFTLKTDAYVVNGFQSGGADPVTANSLYPNFATLPTGADNNRDKAYGGRAHALIGQFLGLGISGYTGRWTNQGDVNRKLTMLGFDTQLRFGNFSARAGAASMNVNLPATSPNSNYKRGGLYGEIGQRFGGADQWQFLVRGGNLNGDDRIVDRNDKQVVGAKLIWKPDLLEWSIEHSRDLKDTGPAKANHSFTNFRVVASF